MTFYNDFVTLIKFLFENYALLKFSNGYDPQFTLREFIEFLRYFAKKIENPGMKEMFSEIFKDRDKIDIIKIIGSFFYIGETYSSFPYLTPLYDPDLEKYTIKINYKLYMGHLKDRQSILSFNELELHYAYYESNKPDYICADEIILQFLKRKPKRKNAKPTSVTEEELTIAKRIAAFMINEIWENHIRKLSNLGEYPRQCSDINKYLLDFDLCSSIHVPSIKNKLLKLYRVLYERISQMYHQDNYLRIAASEYVCLARKNFEFLIDGYEDLIDEIFNHEGFEIDLSKKKINNRYSTTSVYYEDDDEGDIEYRETTSKLNTGNDKLFKKLDEQSKALHGIK